MTCSHNNNMLLKPFINPSFPVGNHLHVMFFCYIFQIITFTHLLLFMQDFNSSATYWPLGGVLSLTKKPLMHLCVSVCAVPVRRWSEVRYCGFCTGGSGSGHPAADQGIWTFEILKSHLKQTHTHCVAVWLITLFMLRLVAGNEGTTRAARPQG